MDVARDGLTTLIYIAGPIMLVALALGVIVALFQSLTQIQEMTLTFVPKILAVFVALLVLFPYMGTLVNEFMIRTVDRIISLQ
jgi:flagellar biosynthetic protein FliQ